MEDNSSAITNSNPNSANPNNSNNPNAASVMTNAAVSNKNNRCNLIVNYLPQSLKEHDFNNLFAKIGPLKSCKLMFDRQTGYSFGYGFVEYMSEEDALKAIDTFNGYQIEHKRLKVALARPNCEETKNTNLYIRNIPVTFDEQSLHSLFGQYGDVVQVRLLRDQNTAFTRRIGFVIMATKQMAQLAIQHLDNTIPPNGGAEPIFVKYADEEGKKRHAPNPNQPGMRMASHPNFNQNASSYLTPAAAAAAAAVASQQGFSFNQASSFIQAGLNPLNLGKIKTNRSSGHQNRYNPLSSGGSGGGATSATSLPNQQAGLNTSGSQPTGASYNPWNMPPASMQGYSSFGQTSSSQQTSMIGNQGFENLINTFGGVGIGGGGGGGAGGSTSNGGGSANTNPSNSYLSFNHPIQSQQHYSNTSNPTNPNYLTAAASLQFAVAAAAALASNTSTQTSNTNLIDPTQHLDASSKPLGSAGHIIYVYGIGQANESDLYSLFSNCGRILRVNVIKNTKTGQCKGYGFVVFETYEEACCAVHTMNGFVYNNRPLQVSFKSFQNTPPGGGLASASGPPGVGAVPSGVGVSAVNRSHADNSSASAMRMLDNYNSNLATIDSHSGPNEMNSFY